MPYKSKQAKNAAQNARRLNKRAVESDEEREARLAKRQAYNDWVKVGRLMQKLLKQRGVNVKIKGVYS